MNIREQEGDKGDKRGGICMSTIDSLALKLNMLGNTIVSKNSFGIIYLDSNRDCHCIRITNTVKGEVRTLDSGIYGSNVSKHFIHLRDLDYNFKLYVKNKTENLFDKLGDVYQIISCDSQGVAVFDGNIYPNSNVIIVLTIDGRLYMINYAGKIVNITPKIKTPAGVHAAIIFNAKLCVYYIGYSVGEYDANIFSKKATKIDKLILTTDKDFKDIQYFDLGR